MKKFILSFAVVALIAFSANAQEKSFIPTSGDISLEVDFTPFGGAPIQANFIKGRFFISDNLAVRAGILFTHESYKDNWETPGAGVGGSVLTEEESAAGTEFGLFPGVELHIGDFNRVSPYIGAEFGFITGSYKYDYSNSDGDEQSIKGFDPISGNNAYTSIGFNLIAGFDVYILNGLYMGAEMGLGLSTTSFKDVENAVTPAGGSTTTTTTENNEKYSDIGVIFNPAIRLGWKF